MNAQWLADRTLKTAPDTCKVRASSDTSAGPHGSPSLCACHLYVSSNQHCQARNGIKIKRSEKRHRKQHWRNWNPSSKPVLNSKVDKRQSSSLPKLQSQIQMARLVWTSNSLPWTSTSPGRTLEPQITWAMAASASAIHSWKTILRARADHKQLFEIGPRVELAISLKNLENNRSFGWYNWSWKSHSGAQLIGHPTSAAHPPQLLGCSYDTFQKSTAPHCLAQQSLAKGFGGILSLKPRPLQTLKNPRPSRFSVRRLATACSTCPYYS